jgi:epoxyqueuosine reductase
LVSLSIKAETIKELAAAVGINQIGITDAKPLEHMEEHLRRRVTEGRLTRFEEKDPLLRLSARHLMSQCRSIVVMAIPYSQPEQELPWPIQEPRGKVARCARNIDYHHVIINKANQLVALIEKDLGTALNYKILCDRSPLLERELARKAGLGWIGKNCTLINKAYGSYSCLATILLDIELEYDLPLQWSCPDCTSCLSSCPTQAIEEPFVLNPKRCLSYLTQLSGIFPREMRPMLKNKIYGCDCCQESCPYNKKSEAPSFPEYAFHLFPASPLLLPLLRMTGREYDLTIGLTSAGWRGKTTLQRNVIIALGNIEDSIAVKPLTGILENDPRPVMRLHAAWALGRTGGPRAPLILDKVRSKDPDAATRREAVLALEEHK